MKTTSPRSPRSAQAADTEPKAQWILPISTSAGRFTAVFTSRGLARLHFPVSARVGKADPVERAPAQVRKWGTATRRALQKCLRGAGCRELPVFDWSGATRFQQQVWRALLKTRVGGTVSYGELAGRMGRTQAARAVGAACGANPIPVLVPCHRVLASNGALGGFSGGLGWKRRLLRAEGVEVSGRGS